MYILKVYLIHEIKDNVKKIPFGQNKQNKKTPSFNLGSYMS